MRPIEPRCASTTRQPRYRDRCHVHAQSKSSQVLPQQRKVAASTRVELSQKMTAVLSPQRILSSPTLRGAKTGGCKRTCAPALKAWRQTWSTNTPAFPSGAAQQVILARRPLLQGIILSMKAFEQHTACPANLGRARPNQQYQHCDTSADVRVKGCTLVPWCGAGGACARRWL